MHEALQLWRTVGNQREVVVVLEGIGWAEFANGEDEKACAAFQESLQAARALGDAHLVNQTMSAVAQVLVALHRVDEARALASEVVAFSSAHDDKRNEHSGWHYLADCALIEEHCQESLGLYRQSLVLARAIGDRLEITYEIQGVAMSLAGLDAPAQALRLAAACRAECERLGVSIHIRFWDALLDKYLGRARVALGPEEAERAWNDGIRLPFESAIVEALAVSPST
jgi:tetratricopeptide (TPR) repeat protein